MYYRGASAAILVYDITDASTFQDVRIWVEELKRNHHTSPADDDPPLIIYVVGAKTDLGATKRQISLQDARQSLHDWFPPPPKPPPNPPSKISSSASSTYGRVTGLAYIRPRFTSLTTSPLPVSNPEPQPPSAALSRAKSARVAPVGKRLNGDAASPGDWRRHAAGARERRWSDAMMWDDAMREEGSGTLRSNGIHTTEDADSEEEEEPWALEKGMELFEVSAKDNEGVQNLFAHLISNIIRRRDYIEGEMAARDRNSVMLASPAPTWGGISDGSDGTRTNPDINDVARKNGGWSCCAS